MVKLDLEYRWQRGRSPRKVETYATDFPELATDGELPVELIHEELQARMQAGDRVTEKEIHDRFPAQATQLYELVGGMAVAGTQTCTYYGETVKNSGKTRQSDVKLVAPPPLELRPGETVDDFELLTQLGRGAFAQVFLSRQVSMERLVALKISRHKGSEPQILAQLDHRNIVRVFDQRASLNPPLRLLYMEVVPGGTLQEVVMQVRKTAVGARTGELLLDAVDAKLGASGAPRPENSANRHWLKETPWSLVVCQLGAQLAEGLAYAHDKGVMHRDIKPANVLLTPEGCPKLADFNVSYNGGRADENPEDTFGGSLAYMSPEQLQACHPVLGGSAHLVRGASDVYSLGLVLWELLCGVRPFADEPKTNEGKLTRIQRMIDRRHYADFTLLCEDLPKDCPDSLRQVLVRCLQPRKEERYSSAAEAARALRLCLDPQSWRLLQEPTNPLHRFALWAPILTLVIAGLSPNALAGFFNLTYNDRRIGTEYTRELLERFNIVQLWINCIVFPLGIAIGIWIVIRLKRLVIGTDHSRAEEGSGRVLFVGLYISLLTLSLWTISGVVFPIALDFGMPLEGTVGFYSHFFMSLTLCGIVAMAYPYFFLTALAVRCYVPALVRNGIVTGPKWRDLQRVRLLNNVFLVLTSLVPMIGILLAVAVDAAEKQKWAVIVALGSAILGFLIMFVLKRFIDDNLDALEKIAVGAPRES